MIKAMVVMTESGWYAIEFVGNIGQHVGFFKKSDGSTKEWKLQAQAEANLRKFADKYGWYVA